VRLFTSASGVVDLSKWPARGNRRKFGKIPIQMKVNEGTNAKLPLMCVNDSADRALQSVPEPISLASDARGGQWYLFSG
jgi:hypothetical protein